MPIGMLGFEHYVEYKICRNIWWKYIMWRNDTASYCNNSCISKISF